MDLGPCDPVLLNLIGYQIRVRAFRPLLDMAGSVGGVVFRILLCMFTNHNHNNRHIVFRTCSPAVGWKINPLSSFLWAPRLIAADSSPDIGPRLARLPDKFQFFRMRKEVLFKTQWQQKPDESSTCKKVDKVPKDWCWGHCMTERKQNGFWMISQIRRKGMSLKLWVAQSEMPFRNPCQAMSEGHPKYSRYLNRIVGIWLSVKKKR